MDVEVEEYIAPNSALAFMLGYWRGWWRFLWHWSSKNLGIGVNRPRRHIAPYIDCGKWEWGFWIWRFSFCFSCQTIEESRAEKRRMFASDISKSEVVLDDILDAEVIE